MWQVDNVSIQAGSPLEAGSPIQAGWSRSLVPIEAGACIRSFMVCVLTFPVLFIIDISIGDGKLVFL